MNCAHEELRSTLSHYDHDRGVLVYFWTCERCGAKLEELHRETYRPEFDPHGSDRYISRLPESA